MWIARINAAARMNDISYSRLMDGLKKVRHRNQQKDAFRKWRSTMHLHSQHFAKPQRTQQNKQTADKAKNKNENTRTGISVLFACEKVFLKGAICDKIKEKCVRQQGAGAVSCPEPACHAAAAHEGGKLWLMQMNYFVW